MLMLAQCALSQFRTRWIIVAWLQQHRHFQHKVTVSSLIRTLRMCSVYVTYTSQRGLEWVVLVIFFYNARRTCCDVPFHHLRQCDRRYLRVEHDDVDQIRSHYVTLGCSELWDDNSLRTLCWERGNKSTVAVKYNMVYECNEYDQLLCLMLKTTSFMTLSDGIRWYKQAIYKSYHVVSDDDDVTKCCERHRVSAKFSFTCTMPSTCTCARWTRHLLKVTPITETVGSYATRPSASVLSVSVP